MATVSISRLISYMRDSLNELEDLDETYVDDSRLKEIQGDLETFVGECEEKKEEDEAQEADDSDDEDEG